MSLLWLPDIQPKCFNLHNTHQKSNCQTLFLYSEKQHNKQIITDQKFRRVQKFGLTRIFRLYSGQSAKKSRLRIQSASTVLLHLVHQLSLREFVLS